MHNIKKILILLVALIFALNLTGCNDISDSAKFKNEYESLNDTIVNNKKVRNISIDSDNPFVYKSAKEIVDMMDNKESFVVYFGFAECPWCRSVITTLIETSKNLGLDVIYYVDIENIRDILALDENNKVIVDKKGTDGYYKLLSYFDNVLDDYDLYNYDNEQVKTNEKRIYAPSVISVVNGKAKDITTGISDSQDDAYMDITEDMKNETYNKFKCIIDCVLESKTSCSTKKEC